MTDILALPHGLHESVPACDYHGKHLGLVSKSALDLVHRSLAHYQAWICGALPDKSSEDLDLGAAFHCALLEPDLFPQFYAIEPDFGDCRKKENKAARDAWRAEHEGCHFIAPEQDAAIRGMAKAVHAHPIAAKAVRDGVPELTVRWKDRDTGLECKSRADYYVRARRMVVDIKSARDASAAGFRKAVAEYRYHVQDALYRAGFAAVGEPIQHFMFVVVEKVPPHAIATYVLDVDAIQRGHEHAARDMAKLAQAVERNEYPGYPVGIQTLDLPPWAA